MRLRTRMIIIALAAAAGALLVVLFVAGHRLRDRALDNARATLFAEARLMARLVRPALAAGASSEELDRLVDAASGDVRARVTIIAPGGRVLADAELSGGALASIENHADRVRRILEVLVDNAVKYTAARHGDGGGRVEVVTGPGNEGEVRLEVVDNGPGIESEHLPRLFERLYRVDKARSRELGGTGRGLSIARHLAEGMQASLTVSSEPGHGTRFVLDVPARPEDPPA